MKKNICFCLLLILIVLSPKHIKASCSDSEIIRLQKLASNVNITYTANENTQKFDIIITNLKNDLVLKDVYSNKNYNTNREVKIKNASSGAHRFLIYAKDKECTSDILKEKYIKLPFYNSYYKRSECKGIENYVYCSKWMDVNLDQSVYEQKINEHLNNMKKNEVTIRENNGSGLLKKIAEIYTKYYYIIIPTAILIMCIAIYKINKKEKLV